MLVQKEERENERGGGYEEAEGKGPEKGTYTRRG